MLRVAKKNLTNPFKLTYLGDIAVSLQSNSNDVHETTLKYSVNDFNCILVCGNDWGREVNYEEHLNRTGRIYNDSSSVAILPNEKGVDEPFSCIISDTDFNDNNCCTVVFKVVLNGTNATATKAKVTSGPLTTDVSLNSIVIYGLGQKKNLVSLMQNHFQKFII